MLSTLFALGGCLSIALAAIPLNTLCSVLEREGLWQRRR